MILWSHRLWTETTTRKVIRPLAEVFNILHVNQGSQSGLSFTKYEQRFLWIISLNGCSTHSLPFITFGVKSPVLCYFRNSSKNQSLNLLWNQWARGGAMRLLRSQRSEWHFRTCSHHSKDATGPEKCKVWGLVLSHAPNNAEAEWNYNGRFIYMCSRLRPRWGRKWPWPLFPRHSGSPQPQRLQTGWAQEPGSSRCPVSWQPSEFHKHFLHKYTPLIKKGCKLFVPFPRSFLPW